MTVVTRGGCEAVATEREIEENCSNEIGSQCHRTQPGCISFVEFGFGLAFGRIDFEFHKVIHRVIPLTTFSR